jgi:hypothetical protein
MPKFVPVAEKDPIAEGLPLYMMFDTVTPGPNSTFWTSPDGEVLVLVTSCASTQKELVKTTKTNI